MTLGDLGKTGMKNNDPHKWWLKVRVNGPLSTCRGYWPSQRDALAALEGYEVAVRHGFAPELPVGPLGARSGRGKPGTVSKVNGDDTKWAIRINVPATETKPRHQVRVPGYWPTQDDADKALHEWDLLRNLGYNPDPLVGPSGARKQPKAPVPTPATVVPLTAHGQGNKWRTPMKDVYTAFLNSHLEQGSQGDIGKDREAFLGVLTGTATARAGDGAARLVLGDIAIGDMTWDTIQAWADSLKVPDPNKEPGERGYQLAPSTRAKWGRHLKQMLTWSVPSYIAASPWQQDKKIVAAKALKKAGRRRFFCTPNEVWDIIEQGVDETEQLLFETLFFSGTRQAECRALTPRCLAGTDVPELVITKQAVPKKGGGMVLRNVKTDGSARRSAIPRGLMRKLKQHVADNNIGVDEPLFPGPRGSRDGSKWMRPEWLNGQFREAVSRARVDWSPDHRLVARRRPPTPHDCRATGASVLQAAGVGHVECQMWLGHETVMMTLEVYTQAEDWADKHPLLNYLKTHPAPLPDALNWLHTASLFWRQSGYGAERFDDAARFSHERWADDIKRNEGIARQVQDIFAATRLKPGDGPVGPMPPLVVPAMRVPNTSVDSEGGYTPSLWAVPAPEDDQHEDGGYTPPMLDEETGAVILLDADPA